MNLINLFKENQIKYNNEQLSNTQEFKEFLDLENKIKALKTGDFNKKGVAYIHIKNAIDYMDVLRILYKEDDVKARFLSKELEGTFIGGEKNGTRYFLYKDSEDTARPVEIIEE